MGLPAFVTTNLITAGSMITPSTEDATFTKGYLIDGKSTLPFRFTTTSGTLTVNLGSAKSLDTIALIQHNLPAGTTITVAVDGGGAASMTWAVTNCYVRITPVSGTSIVITISSSVTVEICELVIGLSTVLLEQFRFGGAGGADYTNFFHETELGAIDAYEGFHRRVYSLPLTNVLETTRAQVDTLYSTLMGNLTPFLLIPDVGVAQCLWGRLDGRYSHSAVNKSGSVLVYNTQINFAEEAAGLRVS